ncbi:MAG TPA: OB-fold nucleic acid binding domain-containing protein, partial [Verrucomicrobiae bacterium]|nr:OB-fold nucleic acid binding domain-containing protein [Verrucomicrobiae bacterium]
GGFAVRMGLQYVKGLGEDDWKRIEDARRIAPFTSLADFVRRTELDQGSLSALAEAGAFEGFGSFGVARDRPFDTVRPEPVEGTNGTHGRLDRRTALWEVLGFKALETSLPTVVQETSPLFTLLDAVEEIAWDYRRTDHSPRGHPLAPLREVLQARGLPDARTVASMRHGSRVRYAGLVICRQRPGTAGGVTFMTLEDETGFVNVVLWPNVFKRHATLAKTARFLGVTGTLQAEHGVVHLVADRLWHPRVHADLATAPSRDFH